MKKIFFFDLDGTILDPKTNSIPISTINALKRLQDNGHFCAIATGRSMKSVVASKLSDIIKWDGFVCSNGQQVYLSKDEPIFLKYMDPKVVLLLEQYAIKHNINLQYESHPSFLLKEADAAVKEAHSFFHEPIPALHKTYENENIDMMMAYTHDSKHFEALAQIDGISVYPGEAPYADIIDSTLSKYEGIKTLLKHYRLEACDYIAFGDSLNDMEMLKNASIAIAMGNANPKLKETADVITRSVDQDGIYKACQVHRWI